MADEFRRENIALHRMYHMALIAKRDRKDKIEARKAISTVLPHYMGTYAHQHRHTEIDKVIDAVYDNV